MSRCPPSNLPKTSLIEQAQMLLTPFRHVWNANRAAHEAGPRLLRERLHGDKLPELPLCHDNFCYAVVQDPVVKGGQANLLSIGEHGIGYGLFHEPVSLFHWARMALRRMAPSNAQTVGLKEGVYKQYALMLNEF
jgi:hypothetical protein